MRNEYGRVCHLIGPGLECGAHQRFYRDVTLAVAKPRGTLGERVAAVDDAIDQPTASSDVDPLQRLGARVWDGQCVGHHVRGAHDEQWPTSWLGSQRVGGSRCVAGSDEHRNALGKAQSRGRGRQ